MMKSLEERLTALELRFAATLPKQESEQEEPMLVCTGGDLYLTLNSKIVIGKSNPAWKSLGIEHETEAKAIEAGKRRVQQEIINNHATRLNKEDGFVADWKNDNQQKCYVVFNYADNKWVVFSVRSTKLTGDVAMSPKSAIYLQEKLNKGLITGVNANGDI